jgi:hypothetical protein
MLSMMGVSLTFGILLSLAGVVPLFFLLRQHYAAQSRADGLPEPVYSDVPRPA